MPRMLFQDTVQPKEDDFSRFHAVVDSLNAAFKIALYIIFFEKPLYVSHLVETVDM